MDVRLEVWKVHLVLLVAGARCEGSQRSHKILLERGQEAVEEVEDVVVYLDRENDSKVALLYQLWLEVLKLVRLVVSLDENEEGVSMPPLRKALLDGLQVLDLQR